MLRFPKWVFAAAGTVLLLAACDRADRPPDDALPRLRVMTFNIEYGGTHVLFDNVIEAIRRAGADVVTVSEAEGSLPSIASRLGWHYNARHYLVSRYPIVEPPDGDGLYVYVEVAPGRVVAVAHAHLPSDPYGPYLVRDGALLEDVLQLERKLRVPKIAPYLAALSPLVERGIPTFLAGDFNSPAHTDWTERTVGTRPAIRYPVAWPVGAAVAAAGFRDSWRSVHPDPVANPGLTWWAGRPPIGFDDPGADDPEDRIDFVWYAGPATALSSEIAGEEGGPEVTYAIAPWVSDHRAVVSEFSVVPAAMPPLVGTERRVYRSGDDVVAVYARAAGELAVVRTGEPAQPIVARAVEGRGRVVFPARQFSAGHYEVRVRSDDGAELHKEFWVLDRDAVPVVEVPGRNFAAGEPIRVRWRNAPGNRNDYLVVVDPDEPPGYEAYSSYAYIGARPDGELTFDAGSAEQGWPVAPGRYVVRLIRDDGYEVLAASAPFSVK
jgi:endonuclease/exonuclease/phosphatase family metal-dependent hydrolase